MKRGYSQMLSILFQKVYLVLWVLGSIAQASSATSLRLRKKYWPHVTVWPKPERFQCEESEKSPIVAGLDSMN